MKAHTHESVLERSDEIVWLFRFCIGKHVKQHGVSIGLINGRFLTWRAPTEDEAEAGLQRFKAAVPHASVGWDSDAYVAFKFRKKAELLRGRTLDLEDIDVGFRGFLLWRLLKPVLIPAVVLAIPLVVFTRSFVMIPLLGMERALEVVQWLPPDEIMVGTLILMGITGWVGFLGWVDRSKGRLAART